MIRHHAGRFYRFGDALITRPYMDCQNVQYAEKIFREIKGLWNDCDILIVEGEQTRLGVGNDLFQNCRSVKRILAPSIGAFEAYDQIKSAVMDKYNGELVILALGPTATVLAADLADEGIQALDVGHIDVEYEWFLKRATTKEVIQGKFVNENQDGHVVAECDDAIYLSQIIGQVKL